ncbi:MAG: TldD/PmbA family protein [Candidatus Kapabacteria bacterium]|nr:TldD/PmbA family protein [Candidatus Kapabacteria bacterium]
MSKDMNLLSLAENLVNYSKSKNVDEIQVSIANEDEFTVEVRNGEIERLTESVSKGVSIKVILDKRVATASTSDFDDETLKFLVDDAIERAKLSSQDEFAGLPDEFFDKSQEIDLEIYDPLLEEIQPEIKINIAKEIEQICLADKRIKLSEGSFFQSGFGEVFIANSKGFSGSFKSTSCSSGVYLHSADENNSYEEGWWSNSVNFNGLMKPEEIAKIAINRVTRLIGAKKIETQKVPVIFERPMTSMLLGFLASCLNGHSIYMNQSFLVDKLGQKIAGENINIIDDGLIKGAIGSRLFDREGVPTRKLSLIENGTLNSYILDTYSGRKLGLKSTGHASGVTNFYLDKGNTNPDEIIKSTDKGLLLTRTIGQGTNPTTGDLSRGAFGLWIEKGEIAFPVAEITISGNLKDLLNSIEILGDDLIFDRSITGPTIKVAEMTVAGI